MSEKFVRPIVDGKKTPGNAVVLKGYRAGMDMKDFSHELAALSDKAKDELADLAYADSWYPADKR